MATAEQLQQGAKARVVLAFAHRSMRDAFRRMLATRSDLELAGAADDSATALDLVERTKPDVLILDEYLPDFSNIDLAAAVYSGHPATRVVLAVRDGVARDPKQARLATLTVPL